MTPTPQRSRLATYRKSSSRMAWGLMSVWAVVSFVIPFYARELSFLFFDWPFSFWMAAQGSIFIYLLIVVFYARRMNKLDAQYHSDHDTPT
jgi:putative solute:sodium symporter small subunit